MLYFAGNSLGLQPATARAFIEQELEDWATYGVEGHFHAKNPWLPYHEFLTEKTARLVGALPSETVVMNSLTVNLHLMMVSFYRPTQERFKILIEGGAFPSDQYAVASQARFHGFDPKDAIVELKPRSGEDLLRDEDILETIRKEGPSLALILIGNVNFRTGQAFDIAAITRAGHEQGCLVGFDLAHGAGNLAVKLHDDGPDFAVWCSYKYLNAGPGAIAGCFVHERHHARPGNDPAIPRFEGWWGHDKATRFRMGPEFRPIGTAEAWQLSNPPIFQLAALRASMELFDEAGIGELRKKSETLTAYLEHLLRGLPAGFCELLTPSEPSRRGAQLSFRVRKNPREVLKALGDSGAIVDFREPDVLRAAPAPLYNSFTDVFLLAEALRKHA
jgi:kynureninase